MEAYREVLLISIVVLLVLVLIMIVYSGIVKVRQVKANREFQRKIQEIRDHLHGK